MKTLILLIVSIHTLTYQLSECENIKNGKFSTVEADSSVTIITRTEINK